MYARLKRISMQWNRRSFYLHFDFEIFIQIHFSLERLTLIHRHQLERVKSSFNFGIKLCIKYI